MPRVNSWIFSKVGVRALLRIVVVSQVNMLSSLRVWLCIALLVCSAFAGPEKEGDVFVLSKSNFDDFVAEDVCTLTHTCFHAYC